MAKAAKKVKDNVVKIKGPDVDDILSFMEEHATVGKKGTRIVADVDAMGAPLPTGLSKKALGLAMEHMSAVEQATAKFAADQWHKKDDDVNRVETHSTLGDSSFTARVHSNTEGKPVINVRRTTMGPAGSAEWLSKLLEQ